MQALFSRTLVRLPAGLCAVLTLTVIAYLSLAPATEVPLPDTSDKAKHFVAYLVLGGALGISLGPRRGLYALIFATAYGIVLEIAQDVMDTGREGSITDALANAAGVACGVWAAKLLRRN